MQKASRGIRGVRLMSDAEIQEALGLRDMGLTYDDIGERLGHSRECVRRYVQRAMAERNIREGRCLSDTRLTPYEVLCLISVIGQQRSCTEVAWQMDITRQAVYCHVHRAKLKIQKREGVRL